jgi:CubicO group peptidase (beta-lactamase class C family)
LSTGTRQAARVTPLARVAPFARIARTGRVAPIGRLAPLATALVLVTVAAPLRAAPDPLRARSINSPAAPTPSAALPPTALPYAALPRRAAPDTIDTWVEAYMRAHHIPGLALGIYRVGRIVKAEGYGLADVELDVPVKPSTIFQSGSVGKQFTSAMILLLARDGKLALDDPITKYLPEGAEAWKGITIRNLLTHTSGIQDYENADPPIVDLRRDYTDAELARRFARLPLVFRPGSTWSYSNTGYVLLGIIIDRLTGAHWNVYLHDRVFGPLGMQTARMIGLPDIIPNRASGYVLEHGRLANQAWVSPTWEHTADGALYFTVLDLARWDAALSGDAFLTASEKREMWTPVRLADGGRARRGLAGVQHPHRPLRGRLGDGGGAHQPGGRGHAPHRPPGGVAVRPRAETPRAARRSATSFGGRALRGPVPLPGGGHPAPHGPGRRPAPEDAGRHDA